MKNKNHETMQPNYYLKEYFTDIMPYSSEHMKDISRFSRLLDNLQGSLKSGEDQNAYAEIGTKIRELNSFLIYNDIALTSGEQKEITGIAGSHLSPAVSKKKIEDVIYRIKQRAQAEIILRRETEARDNEIRELHYSAFRFIDWIKVAGWALEYGTITLFSHRLKGSSLAFLQRRGSDLLAAIIKGISPILDQEYYLLSILEYNSIELFVQMRGALKSVMEIPAGESFDSKDIAGPIDAFTGLYLNLMHNADVAEQGLRKAFRKTTPPHGFWGAYYEFLGTPVFNSSPVRMSEYDRISKSVLGVLLSFYTSQTGVVVRTANQIVYLNHIPCSIESTGKRLTPGAMKCLKENNQEEDETHGLSAGRFAELDRIISKLLPQGSAVSESLARHDSKLSAQQWKQEYESRPMARIKKIVDGYIRFFIEPLTSGNFVPVYDNKEYPDYFEKMGQLKNAIRNFSLMDFELIGTKEKDFVSLQLPENSTPKQLIYTLTKLEIPKASYDSRMALAQSVLKKISGASFQLALVLNDIIRKYHEDKKMVQQDVTLNYDFFTGAVIMEREHSRLRGLMKKEGLTLSDFIEGACSVAFYLAAELNHEGVDSINKELETLRPLMNELRKESIASEGMPALAETPALAVSDEDREKYRDSMTGLMNYQFMLERVARNLYDSSMRYRFSGPRFVFVLEIDGLTKINNLWGHDFGDRILREVSKIVSGNVYQEGRNESDIVLRYESGMILGYLNIRALTSAVDRLVSMRKAVNGLDLKIGDAGEKLCVEINAGIYQEREGSDFNENIKIARKIMSAANRSGSNKIGFSRDQNRIISDKDFSINGELNEGIVTAV